MSDSDLILRIKTSYNIFTKGEKKVADYIINNTENVVFMNISDLSSKIGVGETTIFRFCKTLKLRGYQEFKMLLSLGINNTKDDIGKEDVFTHIYDSNVKAIEETKKLLNEEEVMKVTDIMMEAQNIYFYGVGASMLVAMEGMNRFLHITPKVSCLMDSHMQTMQSSILTKNDVAIIISYSGATRDSCLIAENAKKSGATTIGITRYNKSHLTKNLDYVLTCGAKEGPLEGGSTSAIMSQLYLIEILYSIYYKKNIEVNKQNNKTTTEAVVDKFY